MIANFDETIRPAFNAVVVNSGSYNITVGIRPENGQPGLQFDFKVCYYFFHIHSFIHSFIHSSCLKTKIQIFKNMYFLRIISDQAQQGRSGAENQIHRRHR